MTQSDISKELSKIIDDDGKNCTALSWMLYKLIGTITEKC